MIICGSGIIVCGRGDILTPLLSETAAFPHPSPPSLHLSFAIRQPFTFAFLWVSLCFLSGSGSAFFDLASFIIRCLSDFSAGPFSVDAAPSAAAAALVAVAAATFVERAVVAVVAAVPASVVAVAAAAVLTPVAAAVERAGQVVAAAPDAGAAVAVAVDLLVIHLPSAAVAAAADVERVEV